METSRGRARAHVFAAGSARASVVLGHGAGRGADTADLRHLAASLPPRGVSVVLIDQPWVLAGRRVAAPAGHLDAAWIEVLTTLRRSGDLADDGPLVCGGRSTGARVACRTAVAVRADSLLLLSFPLRPPSSRADPAKSAAAVGVRVGEWRAAGSRPVVLVQGDRDAFGSGADVVAAVTGSGLPAPYLVQVPGADHSLRLRGSAGELLVEAALQAVELTG